MLTKKALPRGQVPVIARKYSHMLSEDVSVWTAYLEARGDELLEVWYDLHVGAAMHVPEGSPEWMHDVAAGVSRKRIDVVARLDGGYWIIEVKPFGSISSIGQVICYRDLFVAEYSVAGGVWAVIVCDQADRDLLAWLRAQPGRARSEAIRGALRAHLAEGGATLDEVHRAILRLERRLQNGAFVAQPAGAAPPEPPDLAAALDGLGL